MAILDALPRLRVTVCIDGKPLQEYDDDEEVISTKPGVVGQYQAGRTVSKYIEAVSDKDFVINIEALSGFEVDCPMLSCHVYLDSKDVSNRCLPLPTGADVRNNRVLRPISTVVDGFYVAAPGRPDNQLIKSFKFCKIETTMEDEKLKDVKKDSELIVSLGEIKIMVYRVDCGRPAQGIVPADISSSAPTKVHEKALKGEAKSHSVSFGTASKLVKTNYISATRLDGDDYPVGIFKFKYRSRDALKSLLIIERSPSPDAEAEGASPPPIDLNNLDETQKRQLARLLQEMNRGRSTSGTPQRTIKRERVDDGESSKKRIRSGKKVIVDLTEDSDDGSIVPVN